MDNTDVMAGWYSHMSWDMLDVGQTVRFIGDDSELPTGTYRNGGTVLSTSPAGVAVRWAATPVHPELDQLVPARYLLGDLTEVEITALERSYVGSHYLPGASYWPSCDADAAALRGLARRRLLIETSELRTGASVETPVFRQPVMKWMDIWSRLHLPRIAGWVAP